MSESNTPPGPPPDSPPPAPPAGSPPPPPPGGGGGGEGAGGAPPPPTGGSGSAQNPNRGLMIVLSYLWILALWPLLAEKDDDEVQWHAKHGLVLFGVEIVVVILITIFQAIVAIIDLGCTGCILHSIFWIAVIVVHVLCIVKGVNGERFLIPGVSQYADKL